MTRTTGARGLSPRLLIVLALGLGMAIGVAAFSEFPVSGTMPTAEHHPDKNPALGELATTAEVSSDDAAVTAGELTPSPGTAGMQVALDPETGEFGMPTAVQRRELSPDLERDLSYSDEGLQIEYRADGSRHVNLEGRFQNHSIAHLREDGSVDIECVQGDAEHHLHECSTTTGEALPEE